MTLQSVTRISAYVLTFSIALIVLTGINRVSAQPVDGAAPQSPDSDHYELFLPLAQHNQAPAVNLDGILTTDSIGTPQLAFLTGDNFNHQIAGTTLGMQPITATLQIAETGPCGSGLVYSDTLSLPTGPWGQTIPALAPGCTGIFTTTATVTFNEASTSISTQFVVNEPFSEIYYEGHGFDRCAPADVEEMQVWWDLSPYKVVNIYLGGIHYACDNDTLDAFWVREVAEQGWDFTAIWVGPQAPCTTYNYRISANPATAYTEGALEAIQAAGRARELGLFGDLTLHYDLEAYSGASTSCRAAVQSFMQGWTDQLHLLGFGAGGYGSACTSYIADWWNNVPTLDQIWIAHWIHSSYNPSATVWDAACLSNSLWPNQQRLRQYTGGHNETWGGVTMPIDSNVFETTAIGWGTPLTGPTGVSDFGFSGAAQGWALIGDRISLTQNSGASWEDITPEQFSAIGAGFAGSTGWLVGWQDGLSGLMVAKTRDAGKAWAMTPLETAGFSNEMFIAQAYVEAEDAERVWIALKIQSGSSFSLGELLASEDGGRTWELRDLPLGEPVHFSDSLNGWTAGGPDGNEFFETQDGGRTWHTGEGRAQQTGFAGPKPEGTVKVQSLDGIRAWALVQEGSCAGPKETPMCSQRWQLMETVNGGHSWTVILSRE